MPPKLQLNVGDDFGEAPGSLLAMAKQSGLSLDVPCDDNMEDSLKVTPDGTLQMLSQSRSEYNINKDGLQKAASPAGFGPGTPTEESPLYFNCRQDDIKVIGNLGSGASANVKKAIHLPTRTLCALKTISVVPKESRDQLQTEIRTLCNLGQHEGLVKFYGAFFTADSGSVSLALEYMNAGSLDDFAKKLPGKRIPEKVLSLVSGKLLAGLGFLHSKHLVHRDIKPANMLLDLHGQPKFADFGISSSLGSTQDMCETNIGTFYYMSPERMENHPYSFAADIWSLGISLVELATGKYPYDTSKGLIDTILEVTNGDPPVPPEGEFSQEFRHFLSLCLIKDPDQRAGVQALLAHPFITQCQGFENELSAFVRSVIPDLDSRIIHDNETIDMEIG